MTSWMSCLISSSFLLFATPALAAWKADPNPESAKGIFCTTELFHKNAKPHIWSFGKNIFAVCSKKPVEKSKTLVLNDINEVIVRVNGKVISLYSDDEIGPTARKIQIKPKEIQIQEYLGSVGQSPEVTTQVVSCATEEICELEEPQCALKPTEKGTDVTLQLRDALAKESDKAKKIEIWRSYFLGGANKTKGEAILIEALLGNKSAQELISADLGVTTDVNQAQDVLEAKVKKISKICAPPVT